MKPLRTQALGFPVFDLKPYLDRSVFRELRDVNYFNQVGIVFGAVTWPNEQDIAPRTSAF